jgi:hypothetical protein
MSLTRKNLTKDDFFFEVGEVTFDVKQIIS